MDAYQGFSPDEADAVKRDFVCAICHSELLVIQLDGQFQRLLVCPEHGNVEDSGRVTRNTVSMEMERAKILYAVAIRNLPEFWGELIEKRSNPIVENLISQIHQARYEQQKERSKCR